MQKKIRRFGAALGLAFSIPFASAQQLSQPEQAMVSYIQENEQASNDLLQKLITINSGTQNLEGVRAVGKVMLSQLNQLGFDARWVPMDEVKRAGVLVAEHPCP